MQDKQEAMLFLSACASSLSSENYFYVFKVLLEIGLLWCDLLMTKGDDSYKRGLSPSNSHQFVHKDELPSFQLFL